MSRDKLGEFGAIRWTVSYVKKDLRQRGVFKNLKERLWDGVGGLVVTALALVLHFPPYTWPPWAQVLVYVLLFVAVTFIWWYLRCLHVAPARIHAELTLQIESIKSKHEKAITELESELETTKETLRTFQGSDDVPWTKMPAWDAVVHILNQSSVMSCIKRRIKTLELDPGVRCGELPVDS